MVDKKYNNLQLRIISGISLAAIFLSCLFFAPKMLYVIVLLIGIGMLSEWYDITSKSRVALLQGLFIVPIAIVSVLLIMQVQQNTWLILCYCATIASVDTFAMIGGKIIGGKKLAPTISPNKTWSGLIVGVLSSSVVVLSLSYLPGFALPYYFISNKLYLFVDVMMLGVIAQLGDLLESYYKRKFNVKDSGNLIPGHGGVLDRFDGILLTAPFLLITNYLLWKE